MRTTSGVPASLARASLLIAALLFLMGGVVDAGLHAGAGTRNAFSSSEREPSAPDVERGCQLCVVLAAPALPAAATLLPDPFPARILAPLQAPAVQPVLRALSARARAPPASPST